MNVVCREGSIFGVHLAVTSLGSRFVRLRLDLRATIARFLVYN